MAARMLIGNHTSAAVMNTTVPMNLDGSPHSGTRKLITQTAIAMITNSSVRCP
jgi:hypothetical protein